MDSLDWSVDPCVDFYNFSCNKWLSDHDIPPRLHSLTQFIKLEQDNNAFLQQKLQDKDTIKKYENVSWRISQITPVLLLGLSSRNYSMLYQLVQSY